MTLVFVLAMSKWYKTSRAGQARRRRARKSNQLKIMQQRASASGASSSLQTEYHVAHERRNKFLHSERKRSATYRKKLAIDIKKGVTDAIVKAKRKKEATRASDLRRKEDGRLRILKAQQRSARKIK